MKAPLILGTSQSLNRNIEGKAGEATWDTFVNRFTLGLTNAFDLTVGSMFVNIGVHYLLDR